MATAYHSPANLLQGPRAVVVEEKRLRNSTKSRSITDGARLGNMAPTIMADISEDAAESYKNAFQALRNQSGAFKNQSEDSMTWHYSWRLEEQEVVSTRLYLKQ